MHKLVITSILLGLAFIANAQRPGFDPTKLKSMPAIGRLYGKVVDTKTKQPVDFATVTLLALQKDSVVSGVLAKANGDFSLEKLPMGRFRLKVSFIGYKPMVLPVTIAPTNLEQDLGNLAIEADAKSLKEVTIQGEKQAVVMTVDRRVYNVDKDLSAKGGTGIDAVKNIPGLSVDADGGVNLRNGSPTIFVDGRPTNLTLEQIPADQIERIEVITNPSAKFDASTSGGILNIVLKKNTKPGYNGVVTLGAGYPYRYNGMANLNIKEGRSNFGLSYSVNSSKNPTKGYTNRDYFNASSGLQTGSYNQNNNVVMENLMQNARLSYDYSLTNRSTLSLSQGLMTGGFDSDEDQSYSFFDSTKALTTYGARQTSGTTRWNNYNTQLQFRKTFPKKGKELSTDITYNFGTRKNNSDFRTSNYNSSGQAITAEELQQNRGTGSGNTITYQLDFTNPITDTAKWEMGIRSNVKTDQTILDVGYKNINTGEVLIDQTLSNNYKITDIVNAAYVTYTNMWRGIGYMGGLRFEQTRFFGELVGKNQTVEYLYPNGTSNLAKAFFPSLYLTKRYGEKHEIQANFARKINRPGFMQIMPFIMFADKLNYRQGNPLLRPEFINTVEINYNRVFKKGNFFTSAYVKQTEGAITQYAYKINDTADILMNTFINGNNMYNMGWENNVKTSFFNRKMDVSVNLNVFYTDINASVGGASIANRGFSWNSKGMASYKLPKNFTVQLNGNYEAPRIIPQGKTLNQYSIDVSLGKEIKKVFNLNLLVNDVFNTRRFGTFYESATLEQNISRRRETRFVRLSLTWRFGDMESSLFKRKAPRRGDSNGGGMDMDY